MTDTGPPRPTRRNRLAGFVSRHRKAAHPPRFSTLLRLLSEEPEETIALSALADTFQDRAFGALMFVFAVPNLLPLPPGSSAVLGLPLIWIAAQLALGRRTLWLPDALSKRQIARADLRKVLARALAPLRRMERVLAPRFGLMFGPVGERLMGAASLGLALVLFLPIPFGNMLPGLAITLFALALLQRDGLAALAGWLVAAVSVGVLALVSGALWAAAKTFLDTLF